MEGSLEMSLSCVSFSLFSEGIFKKPCVTSHSHSHPHSLPHPCLSSFCDQGLEPGVTLAQVNLPCQKLSTVIVIIICAIYSFVLSCTLLSSLFGLLPTPSKLKEGGVY